MKTHIYLVIAVVILIYMPIYIITGPQPQEPNECLKLAGMGCVSMILMTVWAIKKTKDIAEDIKRKA